MKVRREYVRGDENVGVTAERLDGDRWRVRIGDRTLEFVAVPLPDGGVRLITGEPGQTRSLIAYGAPAGRQFMVRVDGHTHTLAAPAARGRSGGGGGDGTIRAPMTGTVLEVLCKPGDVVEADQTLVVLSAMKMEHKLTAGIAGTVQSVDVTADSTVEQGAELVVVEPAEEDS